MPQNEEVQSQENESQQGEVSTQETETTPSQKQEPVKASETIYSKSEEGEEESKTPATWPEDWRSKLAGEDEKALKALERYQSPEAVSKALLAAQSKIRSGELQSAELPENATDEEKAAWREERGIPADPKGYELKSVFDVDYDDMDDAGKATIDAFKGVFHETNVDNATAGKIMDVANQVVQQQLEQEATQDAELRDAVEDDLRAEWGAEYRGNIELNRQFLEGKFGDDWEQVFSARQPNGQRLSENPVFSRFVNEMARKDGGTALVTGESVAGKNVAARIAEIEDIMKTDYSSYTPAVREEYSRLLGATSR